MTDEAKTIFDKGDELAVAIHAIRYAYRIGYMRGAIDYGPEGASRTVHLPDPPPSEIFLLFLMAESKRLGIDND